MTRAHALFGIGILSVLSPLLVARAATPPAARHQSQTQAPPPATPAQAPAAAPKATALILGQVVDGSTGQPVAEAIVTLRPMASGARSGGPDPAALGAAFAGDAGGNPAVAEAVAAAIARAGGAPAGERRLVTGGDGRFVFHSLAPGNYQVSAALNGYTASLTPAGAGAASAITMLAGGGTSGSGAAPSTHALAEGERRADVRLRLWKFAAIEGTVLDDGGEPAVALTVQAMRRTMLAGRARYAPAGSGRTDDRGMYRIGSLVPGDYIVVVPQTQVALPAATMQQLVDLSARGGMGDMDQSAVAALSETVLNGGPGLASAMSNGVRLGGYMVASASGAVPILGADGRMFAYQTAFFAGALVPAQASVVSLRSGEERTGGDFQLQLTPTVRVSGLATGPSGPVANLSIRLVVPADGTTTDTEFDVATTITGSDGSFSFYGVPPGEFALKAQKDPGLAAMAGAMGAPAGAAGTAGSAAPPMRTLYAVSPLTVGASDIDGVVVALSDGLTVSGRVEFDSQTGRQPPASLQNVQVLLLPADGRTPSLLSLMRGTRLNRDGTFQTTGYAPGRYFVSLVPVPAPWQIRAAMFEGRDVFATSIEIRSADVSGLTIELTDRLGQLTGNVKADSARQIAEGLVVVFPADYRAWLDGGMNPRLLRTIRPGETGGYAMPNLLPGDYLAAAIDRAEEGGLQDPAFIELLARVGVRVQIGAESRTQDLVISRVRR